MPKGQPRPIRKSLKRQIIDRWIVNGGVCDWCGKVRYLSEVEAGNCARELRFRVLGTEPLWAYRCLKRDWWHLSRQRPRGA